MRTNTPCGGDAKQTENCDPSSSKKRVCYEGRYNTPQHWCNRTAKGNVTCSVLQGGSVGLPRKYTRARFLLVFFRSQSVILVTPL